MTPPSTPAPAFTQLEQQLLDTVAALRDRQLDWTRQLIAIPTVNPYSGDDSAGSERPGQEWMHRRLTEMGASVQWVPVPKDVYARAGMIGPADRAWDGRDNLVARWKLGTGVGPSIIVNNHMDTVGTAGMEVDPFAGKIENGRIYGRGASDTKANTAMGLAAIEALLAQARGLNGTLIFESVVDEECNGAGAGTLACCLAGVRGDVAIVLDGSAGHVINGCNGIATACLIVQGKAGHNADGDSVSALDKAIVVKQAVDQFAAQMLDQHPTCRTNIGILRAGTGASIVPGQAELHINFCYPIADAQAANDTYGQWTGRVFRERFEKSLAATAKLDPWFEQKPVRVSWIKDPYPYLCDANDPAVRLAVQAATEVHGRPITAAPMSAWFDGAHLARQLGIPTFSLGHGTPGCAHSATEYAQLDQLYAGAQVVALTLRRLFERGI